MTKHKVGDKVKVRRDLDNGQTRYMMADGCYGDIANCEMMELAGKEVTIAFIHEQHFDGQAERMYLIEEDDEEWVWTDEMFEDVIQN